MNASCFWEKNGIKAAAIVESIDRNIDGSFLWVTNVKDSETWCSAKMQDFFGFSEQVFPGLEPMLQEWIHPEDREEYLEGMGRRLQGMDLDHELCIRMRGKSGNYAMFSIHLRALYDADHNLAYLVGMLKNEDIFPDFDAMTNLYSYARYVKELDHWIACETKLAILQIQVEGFSTFNLIYGLDYSGEWLHAVARRVI